MALVKQPDTGPARSQAPRASKAVLLEIGLVLAAGNLAAVVNWWWHIPINTGPVNLIVAGIFYFYLLVVRRIKPGAGWRFSWSNLGLATGAGVALTLPPVVFFIFPVLVNNIDYSPIQSLDLGHCFSGCW